MTKKTKQPVQLALTLDQLLLGHTDPGLERLLILIGGASEADCVELGARFASEDIIAVVPAFATSIVTQPITEEQAKLLIGYSPERLDALIHETGRLRDLSLKYDDIARKGITVARQDLHEEMSSGIELRDIIERTLETLVSPKTALRRQLDDAAGLASPPSSLTRSLRALAVVSEALRAQSTRDALGSIDAIGINEGVIAELRGTADTIDEKAGIVDGTIGGRNAQRELDYQDGVVLTLLTIIYRAFEYAHARSAKVVIPPLGRLKRLVHRPRVGAAQPVPPPVPPVPPVAPTTGEGG